MSPSPPKAGERRGPSALAIAWLLVLALCAVAGGFVYVKEMSDAPRTGGNWSLGLPPGPAPAEAPQVAAPPSTPENQPAENLSEAGPAKTAEVEAPTADDSAGDDSGEGQAAPPPVPEAIPESPAPQPESADSPAPDAPAQSAADSPAPAQPGPDTAPKAAAVQAPRIAVVVTGLGLSQAVSEMAIARLPAAITLSFSPYADGLDQWFVRAQAKGHEVLIDLPMEPVSFPLDDPGPQALLTGLGPARNLERLRWVLGRGQGVLGVAAVMGSRFTTSEADLQPVLQELKARGFLYLDNRSSEQSVAGRLAAALALSHAVNDRTLDDGEPNRESVRARLAQIERLAVARGQSIAMGHALPVTLERLVDWAAGLESRGFALVPISAVAGRPDSG